MHPSLPSCLGSYLRWVTEIARGCTVTPRRARPLDFRHLSVCVCVWCRREICLFTGRLEAGALGGRSQGQDHTARKWELGDLNPDFRVCVLKCYSSRGCAHHPRDPCLFLSAWWPKSFPPVSVPLRISLAGPALGQPLGSMPSLGRAPGTLPPSLRVLAENRGWSLGAQGEAWEGGLGAQWCLSQERKDPISFSP